MFPAPNWSSEWAFQGLCPFEVSFPLLLWTHDLHTSVSRLISVYGDLSPFQELSLVPKLLLSILISVIIPVAGLRNRSYAAESRITVTTVSDALN
jgi:hypothetical protein